MARLMIFNKARDGVPVEGQTLVLELEEGTLYDYSTGTDDQEDFIYDLAYEWMHLGYEGAYIQHDDSTNVSRFAPYFICVTVEQVNRYMLEFLKPVSIPVTRVELV